MKYKKNNFINNIFQRTKAIYDVSKFENITITLIGCGGIGSYMSEFIIRNNININLIDKDNVDLTNLGRQNYNLNDIEKNKTDILKNKLKKINKFAKIKNYNIDILDNKNKKLLKEIIQSSSYVILATDNIESKKEINLFSYKHKIPTLFLSAYSKYGEILFTNYNNNNACFNCIYNKKTDKHINLIENGVIPTIPTIIGLYGLNILLDIINNKENEKKYLNYLFRFNFDDTNITKIKINKNKSCEICSKNENDKNGL